MNKTTKDTATKSAKRGRPRKATTGINGKETVLNLNQEEARKLFKNANKTFACLDTLIGDLVEESFKLQCDRDDLIEKILNLQGKISIISKRVHFYRFLFLMQTLVAITSITLFLLKSSHII